jgi:FkbM family methyltransferase
MKIIYDIGSNKGDNLDYYLKKADKVIAIEADPNLAKVISMRFFEHIVNGRLVVENCIVTVNEDGVVPFYLGKNEDGSYGNALNTMITPDPMSIENFTKVELPSRNILNVLDQYGPAYYMKIDIENYDHILLKYLFQNNIKPPLLSCEAHSVEVFCLMAALGDYKAFKLVDGHTVVEKYKNHPIKTLSGAENYSFPFHSAGPFGEDIKGNWMNMNNFSKILPFAMSWKDIHVSSIDLPDDSLTPQPTYTISIQFPEI